MKRSVVIKLIENLMGCGTDMDLNTQAENLLGHLEELGMLPPKIMVRSGISYGTIPCYKNEWEKE